MKGNIHSIETFGTVDGPGIRTVIFFQGCPLHCLYCHNADTQRSIDGKKYDAEELLKFALKYKSYYKASNGGITATGGEPSMQPEFLAEFFKLCKNEGIHTALDTSGYVDLNTAEMFIPYTDLVLLDIKHLDNDKCKKLTGHENTKALKFLEYLNKKNIPVIIRQVVVPGWTSSEEYIMKLGSFVTDFKCIKKMELLPFHKMGEYKYVEMGLKPPLADVPEFPVQIAKMYASRIQNHYGIETCS